MMFFVNSPKIVIESFQTIMLDFEWYFQIVIVRKAVFFLYKI